MDLETDEDGWIGGSSQSIYARKPQPSAHTTPPPNAPKGPKKTVPTTPGRKKKQADDNRSRSLLERMDMDQSLPKTPPPKARSDSQNADHSTTAASTPSPASNAPAPTSPFRTTPSQGIRRPGAKIPSPLPLTSPARKNESGPSHNTRTPLSASHPIPETPLKLSQRGGPQTPATPHYPSYPNSAHSQSRDGDTSRASGLGIGLTPLKTPVPLAPSPDSVRSPLNEALNLRGRAAANTSIGSPLKSGRSDLHGESLALGSSSSQPGNDNMLDRLRGTRSSLGTSASMWAPKSAATSEPDSTAPTSTTSHTIGSGFSSSNLLGVQTGLDRKRPSHRPNGLQLSLGQEISVMQELEEKAEEEYPTSNVSSATVADTFRIDLPEEDVEHENADDWKGTVVPPTPALGCDSPSSDEDQSSSKPPSRSLDAFGWGSSETRKPSLFSDLPSSSTLEANWSGDDDDERKDDVEVFQDMHERAKASSKDRRDGSYGALPPPPINYGKERTPSPTHRLLGKSPKMDGEQGTVQLPTTRANGSEVEGRLNGQRGSPASTTRSMLASESDGDADVENDRPKRDRKKKGAGDTEAKEGEKALEKSRSLKRDKSERIRGRRASQSKEKDVDKAKVLLPSTTFKPAEELAGAVEKVKLEEDKVATATGVGMVEGGAQQTPVAQRVQSIPAVKDDLFSSPAEPRVELPTSTSPEEGGSVGATPEPPTQPKFDWAADDDELDDELPDLDDWGVTLSPSKPSTETFKQQGVADKGSAETGREGVWRRGDKGRKQADGGKAGSAKGDPLGIRIAGRAAGVEPQMGAMPPASTPYGRWNKAKEGSAVKKEESRGARVERGKRSGLGSAEKSMHAPTAGADSAGTKGRIATGAKKKPHSGKK
ncbi:hypothetical protein PHSY_004563 [Pseudozyma hubeiensis SY62]|uniref:Uncharacterized protein n=1 Tax=Pseudozyma hubeiensis (strain SY62) TaxID=1305764 RepID=R9P6L5_PSEHS|nr:hypothetical protein PHSY_004563 [Pseudozyma hubeiensis SY62]GAC96979.1 hypothetical protein PHSY_004563 [Pseudozyma hubeiensis SY62]